MAKGIIKYFKTPERKTIFPVTRAEAVISGSTTLDVKLATHDTLLQGLRDDIDAIGRISESVIDTIVESHWGNKNS